MKISTHMDLYQLVERMGSEATLYEADIMRDLLVERFDGQDTSDIPDTEWLAMLEEAAAQQ